MSFSSHANGSQASKRVISPVQYSYPMFVEECILAFVQSWGKIPRVSTFFTQYNLELNSRIA
jgi:hypothetical protein